MSEPIDITPEDSVIPVYLIPLTPEEEAERKQWATEAEQREKDEIAKVDAKASAISKLSALGLTEEEVTSLLRMEIN